MKNAILYQRTLIQIDFGVALELVFQDCLLRQMYIVPSALSFTILHTGTDLVEALGMPWKVGLMAHSFIIEYMYGLEVQWNFLPLQTILFST